MEFAPLVAAHREAARKSGARSLRAEGKIPAVAYGKTLKSTPVSVDPLVLAKLLSGSHGLNTVIKLELDGHKDLLVMVREFTYHPVSRKFLHADFVQVKLEEDVDVEVPLHVTGKAHGVVLGGILRQIYRKLPLRCKPDQIPSGITVDVTHLDLGHAIKVQDLKLSEGVRVRLAQEQSIVNVVAPEKERGEEAAAPGAAAAAPAAAGKAAPAAAGKAAPAAAAGKAAAPAAKAAAPAAKKK